MKILRCIYILLFIILASPLICLAEGGVEGGNGGDNRSLHEKTAWRLFPTKNGILHYCVRTTKEFPLRPEIIVKLIDKSFDNWFRYIKIKIHPYLRNAPYFAENAVMSQISTMPDQPTGYTNCQGDEDIVFKFGMSTPAIEREKSKYYNPIAFGFSLSPSRADREEAIREHFKKRAESPAGAGPFPTLLDNRKGVIWLNHEILLHSIHPTYRNPRVDDPEKHIDFDWSPKRVEWTPARLEFVLTHEIGQTFGNGHVPGTIMDKDAIKKIINPNPITSIDQQNELYICLPCSEINFQGLVPSIEAELDYAQNSEFMDLTQQRQNLFEEITGNRLPMENNSITVSLDYLINKATSKRNFVESSSMPYDQVAVYFKTDQLNTVPIIIDLPMRPTLRGRYVDRVHYKANPFVLGKRRLSRVFGKSSYDYSVFFKYQYGYHTSGRIININRSIDLIIDRNMNSPMETDSPIVISPLVISIKDNESGIVFPIFIADQVLFPEL